MNEFLSMSSGCGIGGIQLTEILLSWYFASYSVVKLVYIVVFCREAMKRCGITLATL